MKDVFRILPDAKVRLNLVYEYTLVFPQLRKRESVAADLRNLANVGSITPDPRPDP